MILSVCLIVGIVLLDQITKWIVVETIPLHGHVPFLEGVVRFTYVRNEGAAFGMLSDQRWVFLVLSTVGIIGMCYVLYKYGKESALMRWSISFIVGGGIGNMIDRLFRVGEAGERFVVDFIDFQFMEFAVFNVADSFISIGAVLFVLYVIKDEIVATMKKKGETDESIASDN